MDETLRKKILEQLKLKVSTMIRDGEFDLCTQVDQSKIESEEFEFVIKVIRKRKLVLVRRDED